MRYFTRNVQSNSLNSEKENMTTSPEGELRNSRSLVELAVLPRLLRSLIRENPQPCLNFTSRARSRHRSSMIKWSSSCSSQSEYHPRTQWQDHTPDSSDPSAPCHHPSAKHSSSPDHTHLPHHHNPSSPNPSAATPQPNHPSHTPMNL